MYVQKYGHVSTHATQVVSAEVRQLIEERQRKAAEAAAARQQGPLTDRQIAALKRELASHMQVWGGVCEVLW